MSQLISRSYPTPVGPLTIIADGTTVVAAGFCSLDELTGRLSGLGPVPTVADVGSVPTVADVGSVPTVADIGPVDRAVSDYFNGDVDALDRVDVSQTGTGLQQQVWEQLRLIPAGTSWSYRQLAEAVGRPEAARAVGSACGRNLIAPFVPCHRARRSDGSPGGYAYGLEVKRWLLDHEAL